MEVGARPIRNTTGRNRRSVRFRVLLLASCLAHALAGCAVRTLPAPDRTERALASAEPIEWPRRWTDDLPRVAEMLPSEYRIRDTIELYAQDEDGTPESREIEFTIAEVVRAEAGDMGVVREVRRLGFRRSAHDSQEQLSLQFMSWEQPPDEDALRDGSAGAYIANVTSHLLLTIPADDDVRGLVVVIGPHTTLPWSLRERLPERGWAMLHIGMTRPNGRPSSPTFAFDHDTPIETAAARIAAEIDHRIAEYAYGAEATVDYVRNHVRVLRDVPVAVLGLSRGALIAPAVAVRLNNHASATVLGLGGTNLLEIAASTSMHNHGLIEIVWLDADGKARELSRRDQHSLMRAHLDESQLDPHHLAPHLHSQRVLLITGMFDRIIPASTGTRLHERLSAAERWNFPLGHNGTAWIINWNPDRIIDWMNSAVSTD